jgi:hypothetical protein
VDTQVGSERESAVLNRGYRYLDPAVFAALEVPRLSLGATFPDVNGVPEVPSREIRLALSISAPADTGDVRLSIINPSTGSIVEVASLFHAATRSLIPLYPLPDGEWDIQYQMFDLAGNPSRTSDALTVRIVSPQNILSQEDPYSYGVDSSSRLLRAISRDALSVGGTNTSITIDADGSRIDAISDLNVNPLLNADGALRAEIQIDNVAVRPDGTVVALAQQDIDARFGAGEFGDFVFQATDVIMFRLYPQVVDQSGQVVDQATNALFAQKVVEAYTGAIHQVDIGLAEGTYSVADYEVSYYKVMPDGTIFSFDWDEETGTGASFLDTNNDGYHDLITLFIRDGGRGDVDGTADGVILDPGFAVFFQRSVAPPPPPSSSLTPIDVPEGPRETPSLGGSNSGSDTGKPQNDSGGVNVGSGNPGHAGTGDGNVNVGGGNTGSGIDTPSDGFGGVSLGDGSAQILDKANDRSQEVKNLAQNETPKSLPRVGVGLVGPVDLENNLIVPFYGTINLQDRWFGFARSMATSDKTLLRINGLFSEIEGKSYLVPRTIFDEIEEQEKTNNHGFEMVVIEISDEPLAVYRGQPDLTVSAGILTEYQIQPDVFAHSDPNEVVVLKLTQANGQALPAWIQFNGKTGKLILNPPEGFTGNIVLQLVALDKQGREVVTIFQVIVRDSGQTAIGRMSFSDKIKQNLQAFSFNFMGKET